MHCQEMKQKQWKELYDDDQEDSVRLVYQYIREDQYQTLLILKTKIEKNNTVL